MSVEPLRSSVLNPYVAPAYLPSEQTIIKPARIKRASAVVSLETQKLATELIRAGDKALSFKYSVVLKDQALFGQGQRQGRPAARTISDIPAFSTFGMAWAELTYAIQNEPFASFASKHKIDTSTLRLNTESGWQLECIADGKRATFSKYDPGWWQATAAVTAAAQALTPTLKLNIDYTDANHAPADVIGDFYAASTNGSIGENLYSIFQQNKNQTFEALREPDATAPEFNRPAYRYVRQRQQEAIADLSVQIAKNPKLFAPSQPSPIPGTPNPPSPAINPMAAIARRQFAGEPTLHTVIARLLGDKLKASAPGLDIDVNRLAIATPDPDHPGQFKQTHLMTLAWDYLTGGDAPVFGTTHRVLDTRPDLLERTGNPAGVPLPLDLSALSTAIRALPGQLNAALDTDARAYWSQPAFSTPSDAGTVFPGSHRALVSHILRSNLQQAGLKQPGLDDEQRKTVDMLVRHPQGSTRPAPLDPKTSGATVYALPGASPDLLIHRGLSQPDREILLRVEPSGNITPYSSWDQLPNEKRHLEALTGNMFDAQADILIKQHQGNSLVNAPPLTGAQPSPQAKTTLPDWLGTAGEAERFVMHELSLGLASFTQLNKGRGYNSDIPDIRTFAQAQFDRLPESQKLTQYAAKDLEVVFKVPYGTLSSGGIDRQTMSLTDMLLNNLSGLPDGQIEVFFKTGLKENGVEIKTRVPALEKEQVLKTLVNDLDIGKTYPALLKEKLLDNPARKAERQALFAQQVPLELQVKALELSIKGEAGFNPTGFRYVQEILKPGAGPRTVDGKDITLRPLAFDNQANGKIDVVEGAYLIEPKDSSTGPHILYRPLIADAPLLQFASRQALLEAIQKKGKLQNDTLAWLPDENTRQLYSGNGFKHPNLVLFGFNLGSVPLNETIPLAQDSRLQQTLQAGTLMEHLYEDNARNLISLAEHHSTSDAKSRWASLKHGGFLLLNALLPALRGPAATLGLLLQAPGTLKDIEALGGDNTTDKEAALTDLLLNLATLLVHFKPRSSSGATKMANAGSVLVEHTAPSATPPKNRIVLGGPAEIKPLAGDIQAFVDTYNGKQRLNIMGHGEKPIGEQPAHIYGEGGKQYTAEDIDQELLARGIDIRSYPEVRLLACYSSNGGEQSLAAKLNALTGVRVKGFEQEIITDYEGIDDEDPYTLYASALAHYRKQYASLSDADIHLLAERQLNRKLAGRDINFNILKDNGTQIELNIGSAEKPVFYRTKVDYQPRTYGPPKIKPASAKPVEVLMGYSHTAEDAHSVLSTRSLTDCSALAVLSDLKDGVYQKRTLMHLTGSNLEYGLFDNDTYQLLDELDRSLANGGKVIFVGGVESQSTAGMGSVLDQSYQGKKPLLDLLRKPGVDTVIASSLGVDINPDGTFKLIEGTGKGTFSQPMINAVFDFAE